MSSLLRSSYRKWIKMVHLYYIPYKSLKYSDIIYALNFDSIKHVNDSHNSYCSIHGVFDVLLINVLINFLQKRQKALHQFVLSVN